MYLGPPAQLKVKQAAGWLQPACNSQHSMAKPQETAPPRAACEDRSPRAAGRLRERSSACRAAGSRGGARGPSARWRTASSRSSGYAWGWWGKQREVGERGHWGNRVGRGSGVGVAATAHTHTHIAYASSMISISTTHQPPPRPYPSTTQSPRRNSAPKSSTSSLCSVRTRARACGKEGRQEERPWVHGVRWGMGEGKCTQAVHLAQLQRAHVGQGLQGGAIGQLGTEPAALSGCSTPRSTASLATATLMT